MEFKLSARLKACCDYVRPGAVVADVGCDHGYTSIYLLEQGIAKKVYACDVKEGPLSSARRNCRSLGLGERISFYLSDGVQSVPRDFDTLICAGMGADVMVGILSAAPWLESGNYHLILQCQSRTPTLRRFLSDRGYRIREEAVVRDGRFLYTVMDVVFEKEALTEAQTYFSPALVRTNSPEVGAYYRQVIKNLRIAAEGQKNEALAGIVKTLEETVPGWIQEDAT